MTSTVFVTGTGTEIGKTWWTAAIARGLRARGADVRAVKPAQSFPPGDEGTDAEVLADATGAAPHDVCPPHRWYEIAVAPPMAAARLGRPAFSVADLAAETATATTAAAGLVLVEGAGGPRSPLAADGDNLDLARALQPDVVLLVADAGLGTINAVRLAAEPIAELGRPLVVALNRFTGDDLHRENAAWLGERDGFDVVTDPTALVVRWATGSVVDGDPTPGNPARR